MKHIVFVVSAVVFGLVACKSSAPAEFADASTEANTGVAAVASSASSVTSAAPVVSASVPAADSSTVADAGVTTVAPAASAVKAAH